MTPQQVEIAVGLWIPDGFAFQDAESVGAQESIFLRLVTSLLGHFVRPKGSGEKGEDRGGGGKEEEEEDGWMIEEEEDDKEEDEKEENEKGKK